LTADSTLPDRKKLRVSGPTSREVKGQTQQVNLPWTSEDIEKFLLSPRNETAWHLYVPIVWPHRNWEAVCVFYTRLQKNITENTRDPSTKLTKNAQIYLELEKKQKEQKALRHPSQG
jgi:hypothetical protein